MLPLPKEDIMHTMSMQAVRGATLYLIAGTVMVGTPVPPATAASTASAPAASAANATAKPAASAKPAPARHASAFRFEEMTIAALQDGMKAGRWTSKQLVQEYIARIEALDRKGPAL